MAASLRLSARTAAAELLCPFCRDTLADAGQLVGCTRCSAQLHSACWREHGRCPCCRETTCRKRAFSKPKPAPGKRWLRILATSPSNQCAARTRRGTRCLRVNSRGDLCWQHAKLSGVVRHRDARRAPPVPPAAKSLRVPALGDEPPQPPRQVARPSPPRGSPQPPRVPWPAGAVPPIREVRVSEAPTAAGPADALGSAPESAAADSRRSRSGTQAAADSQRPGPPRAGSSRPRRARPAAANTARGGAAHPAALTAPSRQAQSAQASGSGAKGGCAVGIALVALSLSDSVPGAAVLVGLYAAALLWLQLLESRSDSGRRR